MTPESAEILEEGEDELFYGRHLENSRQICKPEGFLWQRKVCTWSRLSTLPGWSRSAGGPRAWRGGVRTRGVQGSGGCRDLVGINAESSQDQLAPLISGRTLIKTRALDNWTCTRMSKIN